MNQMNDCARALCEAVATEAALRNVCVYHDNGGRDIVVSNNVYPTLADVDDTGSDAAKWDAINSAWRKIETLAGVVGVAVHEVDSGTAAACSLIRIEVASASEAVKCACKNGYPTGPVPCYDGARWNTWPENPEVYPHDPFEYGGFRWDRKDGWERVPHGWERVSPMKKDRRSKLRRGMNAQYCVIVSGHNKTFLLIAYWCERGTTKLEAMLRRASAMSDTSSLVYASGLRTRKRAEAALQRARAECRFI